MDRLILKLESVMAENQFCKSDFGSYNEEILDNLDKFNEIDAKDDVTAFLLNVQSLNSNFELLATFLMSLDTRPSLLVCTKTWKIGCEQMFHLEGYYMHYNRSRLNAADGMVVYVREDLEVMGDQINVPFTDHYPLITKIRKSKQLVAYKNDPCDTYVSHAKLIRLVSEFDWGQIFKISNPNTALDFLVGKIQEFTEYATKKSRKKRKK